MENYDEHDKNYGALVNSISVAMVDKARGILKQYVLVLTTLQQQTQNLPLNGIRLKMEI